MTPEQAQKLLVLLGRVPLQGNEAPDFMALIQALQNIAAKPQDNVAS